MKPQFKFNKYDLKEGTLVKTKLSKDLLVVKSLETFAPWEHVYFRQKLLEKPDMAFQDKMTVDHYLLGSNRVWAIGPDGRDFFPRVKQINYIINNE